MSAPTADPTCLKVAVRVNFTGSTPHRRRAGIGLANAERRHVLMPGMDVDLEIHAPGLDLHHQRWNYHVLFMDEVHDAFDRIASFGWRSFKEEGRGTIYVDRDNWMTVISAQWSASELLFPCTYVSINDASADDKFSPLRAGFRQLVEEYDPETQFILTVEHHSAELLSTYLMRSNPGPKEAYETAVEVG